MQSRRWIAAAVALAAAVGSPAPAAQAAAKHGATADFDGDGRSDFAVWHPATGFWRFATLCDLHPDTGCGFSHGHLTGTTERAIAVPGDYDGGDGRSDPAIFDPDSGLWTIVPLRGGPPHQLVLGEPGDIPVPGNYDSDRDTDPAVFRPSDGTWRWVGGGPAQFGAPGDRPVPGDYDGDGVTDLAVYRPSEGLWIVRHSRDGVVSYRQWGMATDVPVPGDYDGDERTDLAVWRAESGHWWILRSGDGAHYVVTLGEPGDDLVPADYDGDGAAEVAVYRRSAPDYSEQHGMWLIAGRPSPVRFGGPGEVPAFHATYGA